MRLLWIVFVGAALSACSETRLTCGEGTREQGGRCVLGEPTRTCGAGTHEEDGACVADAPDLECGAGTHVAGNECVPDAILRCGEGTREERGACVPGAPAFECGPGTHAEDGACVPDADALVCGEGTRAEDGACVPDAELVCGEGTRAEGGQCVPRVRCGEGTREDGGACVPGFARIECGPGTHEEGGVCVPDAPEVECGPGTHLDEGACVLDAPALDCGEGTHPDGDRCVPDVRCGPGTVARLDECVSAEEQWVHLPVPDGVGVTISQGFRSNFSHQDESEFAVDFDLAEGSPVTAARGGTVLRIKEDSNQGCPERDCAADGNFVEIDHGDGTIAQYFHLQQDGALVEPGDVVCAGDRIALSGNTGFTTGPHLHLAIYDPFRFSLPIRFFELAEISDGVPFAGRVMVSQNTPAECAGDARWSACPADAYLSMGVSLSAPPPCTRVVAGVQYPVEGRVLSGTDRVRIGVYSDVDDGWIARCEDTAPDGTFRSTVAFENNQSFGFMMIAAARQDECRTFQGWQRSPRIVVEQP